MSTPVAPAPAAAVRDRYDIVVAGGGPAGTTFGHLARRAGYSVLVIERDRHPRFCIGESLLPSTSPVWRALPAMELLLLFARLQTRAQGEGER